ncbi:hypothetical protein OGAPHI_000011 [Ogataea philodendri]|uniref:Uncharacterized protein n=1 Tax=Ogataea philodendri TaxID=1378263 RepID=A0A9P8TAY7_9ASCO|nr:uncharacterized protein OGAPHI_000011 [Ogataea philodendri]KAH3671825.1 hypothetical protein OGAPHI_000011 [Ogataea philodendri]
MLRVIVRRYATSPIQRPSAAYLQQVGRQPEQQNEEQDGAEKAKMQKMLVRRSLRMTFWQMFLIALGGSSVLNIMRTKNEMEELDDFYRLRFKKFEQLIGQLEQGKAGIDDVDQELSVLNDRFEHFGLAKSEFRGVRTGKQKQSAPAQEKPKVEVTSYL